MPTWKDAKVDSKAAAAVTFSSEGKFAGNGIWKRRAGNAGKAWESDDFSNFLSLLRACLERGPIIDCPYKKNAGNFFLAVACLFLIDDSRNELVGTGWRKINAGLAR